MQKVHLVVIDPQNDFCHKDGSLFVPGATEDMDRLTTFIKKNGNKLHDISVTLDSHHKIDIAHNVMWKDSQGNRPSPFTIITKDDVASGRWTTTQPSMYKRALDYVTKLEENGKYPLCIWPDHCLIGSWGNNVYSPLFEQLTDWENSNFAMVNYVTKGSNYMTEHYSALKADVPDPSDPSTQINTDFIRTLEESDFVAIAGEAGSHCLANTVRDIADAAGDDFVSKMVLLQDAF
jgi:nicotinamidase-related amidase